MDIFNTQVFSTLKQLFDAFWQDSAGRIFILTFIAYASSYMLYSGYISWFAGGYGGLTLSQAGFTALDFLALVPTAFLLLAEAAKSSLRFLWGYIWRYILLPLLVFYGGVWIIQSGQHYPFPDNVAMRAVGLLIFLVGAMLGFVFGVNQYRLGFNLSPILSIIGVSLFTLSAPFTTSLQTLSLPKIDPTPANEIMAVLIIAIVAALPFFMGLGLGHITAKYKLLSEVERLVLRQPIPIVGLKAYPVPIKSNTPTKPQGWFVRSAPPPQPQPEMFVYTDSTRPIHLIASFSRTTAFYIPLDNASKKGRMVVVANDLISSLELKSRRG